MVAPPPEKSCGDADQIPGSSRGTHEFKKP